MFGSASMRATGSCHPTVIRYSRSVGPWGFVGATARPGRETRTAGGVRSGERMFAAMMVSYLGTGGIVVGALSGCATAGTASVSARGWGRAVGASRSAKPPTRSTPAATYKLRTSVTGRRLRQPRDRVRAGGATRRTTGVGGLWRSERYAHRGKEGRAWRTQRYTKRSPTPRRARDDCRDDH